MAQNKEFAKMSNEELCAVAAKLKFQLVEARFKMSSGELEKVSVIKDIRKTIAKIFTELTNRGYKVSIGSHGITMYEIAKGNKPIAIDADKIQALMNKDEKKPAAKKAEAKKEVKPAAKAEVKAEEKKAPAKKPAAKKAPAKKAAAKKEGDK